MTSESDKASEWKIGNEFAPYHPDASHVDPAYRDGWNACYKAARAQRPGIEVQRWIDAWWQEYAAPPRAGQPPKEVEPIAWLTNESLRSLCSGGNASRGTVPAHRYRTKIATTPVYLDYLAPAQSHEAEFELHARVGEDDEFMAAGASGPRAHALREIAHYAALYADEGPLEVFEVARTKIDLAVLAGAPGEPQS